MVNSDRSGRRTSESWLVRLFRRLGGDGRRRNTVQCGDRFGKIGELFEGPYTTWQVWQTVNFVDMPHAKLIQEESPHRIVTVSLSTLLDKRYYRRLPAAADVQPSEPPASQEPQIPRESAALRETADGTGDGRQAPSPQSPPEPQPRLDQAQGTETTDEIIRFVDPESHDVVAKTNPFGKAREGKSQTAKTVSRTTH